VETRISTTGCRCDGQIESIIERAGEVELGCKPATKASKSFPARSANGLRRLRKQTVQVVAAGFKFLIPDRM